jgi:hypothetical protein
MGSVRSHPDRVMRERSESTHACFAWWLLILRRDGANLLIRDVLISVFRVDVGATFCEKLVVVLGLKLFLAKRALGCAHGGSFRLERVTSGDHLRSALPARSIPNAAPSGDVAGCQSSR